MSLVRISKQLLHEVNQKISNIKGKDADLTLNPLKPAENKELLDALYEVGVQKLWGVHLHYKDTLPKEWLVTVERLDVSVIDGRGLRIGGEISINRRTLCPPNALNGYSYVEVKVPLADAPATLKDAMEKYDAAQQEFANKYDSLHRQIIGFLRSCKSLNDALKKFPDLALYVPKHYLDKVEEVKERAAKDEEVPRPETEIDRDLITSIGVLGKLQS